MALNEGQALRLGRAPESDIKFSEAVDDSVSGLHAELRLDGGRLFVEDKRSANGTFLNGAPCPPFQKVAVPDGSRLRLAREGPEMQLTTEAAPVQAAAAAMPTATGATVPPPKETVGKATLLREIDRARQEERDVMVEQVKDAKKSTGLWVGLGLLLVLLLAGGGIGGALWWSRHQAAQEKAACKRSSTSSCKQLDQEKRLWADIEKKVSPAVAHIRCFWRVRIPRRTTKIESHGEFIFVGGVQGSGVQIRPGLILTAKHVAEPWKLSFENWDQLVEEYDARAEYDLLDVQFPDQQPLNGSLVAAAEQQDLAVLQIQPTVAPEVPITKSNAEVNVTDRLAVVGYPADLGQTPVLLKNLSGYGSEWAKITLVTPTFVVGTVSQPLTGSSGPNYLYFDASATHGNSGGAVVNDRGELIGIVSQKYQQSEVREVFGLKFVVQEPVDAGNMAVSPDDIQAFLRSRGLR